MVISQALTSTFSHQPNSGQLDLFYKLERFIQDKNHESCFILKGYAGTGKTSVVSALVKVMQKLKLNVVLLAPTGRAAKVLSSYSGVHASTIHRRIYRKKTASNVDSNYSLSPNMSKNTLFVVDEASMISDDKNGFDGNSLLDDLIQYVYNEQGNRILFIGDAAQLPPVQAEHSPALSVDFLRGYGFDVYHQELTEVVRQEKESGILYNATQIRDQIRDQANYTFPQLNTAKYKDVYRMNGEKIIEGLNYAYDKFGMENSLVVCRSNKSANIYNQHIRNQILWREDEITGGDLIMVVKNNYYWMPEEKGGFIANGEIAKITRVKNVKELYGFRFADAQIQFSDSEEYNIECKILLDTLYTDNPSLPYEDQRRFFNEVLKDYEGLPRRKQLEEMKTNPYYNALQIKFAYAVTCHKAQGGQWEAVFVDQGYLTEEMINKELLRWLYTATTRATKELFFVNFTDEFFI
ncbi:ATP-dependent DNA helicase [Pseudopedobacter beijingensis]|uniref:ATP-dependent RecD-like DNA helicase n=1 Tax=Pseudopedobacter beijingensis TaxID=1207056 RepID=A0ABW4IEH3_9SPHI